MGVCHRTLLFFSHPSPITPSQNKAHGATKPKTTNRATYIPKQSTRGKAHKTKKRIAGIRCTTKLNPISLAELIESIMSIKKPQSDENKQVARRFRYSKDPKRRNGSVLQYSKSIKYGIAG
ncbi:unnamed protein product [Rhizophagus irregularis]|nr:unnamed protein product [Rhizophagus irregularis]